MKNSNIINTTNTTNTTNTGITTSVSPAGTAQEFTAKPAENRQERMRRLEKEMATLRRAAAILQAEFGADPAEPLEMGYALCKGMRELKREYRNCGGTLPEDRYNPFWADSRRR